MVDISQALESEYLTVHDVKDSLNKRLVIINEGQYEETTYGLRLAVLTNFNCQEKKWHPNKDSLRNLKESWGKETKEWVGKPVLLRVIRMKDKEMIIAYPEK